MVAYYETYWTYRTPGELDEHTGGTVEKSFVNSSNDYTRECGGENIQTGTPITL